MFFTAGRSNTSTQHTVSTTQLMCWIDADLVAGGGADASVGEGGGHDGHALARHLHGAALQVEVQDGVDVAVMARGS